MFNRVLRYGFVPDDWCSSLVMLIYKKGNRLDPINYRGIALMNCITKIFTTLIATRLKVWSEANQILPECQAGFRPGRSCEDIIFSLQAKIALATSKARKLYVAMVDFRRAFDSVDHTILWQSLYEAGVSAQIIKVLQSLYSRATMQVTINAADKTGEIDVTEGVLQGDSLSPLIFIIFIRDIIPYFIKAGHINIVKAMEILFFADDMSMSSYNVIDLQDKLNTLQRYCAEKRLKVNTSKTEIIVFNSGGRPKKITPIKYEGSTLNIVKHYKVLGIMFTSSGSFKTAADFAISKGNIALGSIWQTLTLGKNTSWNTTRKLFDTTVASTVLYGSSIWGLNHIQEVERIQTSFYKRFLNLPRATPGYMIRLETSSINLGKEIALRAIRYWLKIIKMNNDRYPRKLYNQLLNLPTNTRKA